MGTSDCDGDFNFGVMAGLTRFSNWFRNVPELIIVGIGYDMETGLDPLSWTPSYAAVACSKC
jgi:hypothetical protein